MHRSRRLLSSLSNGQSVFTSVALTALIACASAQPRPTNPPVLPSPAPVAVQAEEYAGVYTVTEQEDRFVPCGIRGVSDGWSLNFRNSAESRFIGRENETRGMAPL